MDLWIDRRAAALALAALAAAPALAAPAPAPAPAPAHDDRLQVVATLPDLGDLAEAIGGDLVEVQTLARPGQNLHAVRVKPSHLVAVSRADLFLQVGLSLEHAWVPGLLRTARNRDVMPGMVGFVSAGDGYEMIEVPERMDRSQSADVHPMGNPHVNLSLGGGPHMAAAVLEGLVRVDPGNEAAYEAGFAAWKAEYDEARARWDAIAAAVAEEDAAACLYHQEFDYLLGEMGLEIAAFLEPRPGLAPTPSHLAGVIATVRERGIPVVLTAPWSNNRNTEKVADATDAGVLELPVMAGGAPEHETWIGMIDDCVTRIAEAYGVDPEEAVERAKQRAQAAEAARDGDGG